MQNFQLQIGLIPYQTLNSFEYRRQRFLHIRHRFRASVVSLSYTTVREHT